MRPLLPTCLLLAIVMLLVVPAAQAQVCYGNYYLHTQDEVDAFDCVEVEGDLYIGRASGQTAGITHLGGLSELVAVGGHLDIRRTALTNLTGLDNITTVGGDFRIISNYSLFTTAGLGPLESVGGKIEFFGNSILVNLDGFEQLTHIDGSLLIHTASYLSPRGDLTQIDGLSNLVSVGGNVQVSYQRHLQNVDGLAGLTSVGGNLRIFDNPALSECTLGLEDLLTDGGVGGDTYIRNNAPGCNSVCEALGVPGEECSGPPQICEGNRLILEQREIDNFNCSVLTGNLQLGLKTQNGTGFNNLDGLRVLTEIGGGLTFELVGGLTDFSGLENLVSIGGTLQLFITSFQSLEGLDALTTIGSVYITNASLLTNLDGLSSVTSIESFVQLINNSRLGSCSSLADLIRNGDIGGEILLSGNAPGCNSIEEILNSVDAEDEATPLVTTLAAPFPNPTAGATSLAFTLTEPADVRLTVYDALGRRVAVLAEGPHAAGAHETSFGVGLPAGTYIVRFEVGAEAWSERVTLVR